MAAHAENYKPEEASVDSVATRVSAIRTPAEPSSSTFASSSLDMNTETYTALFEQLLEAFTCSVVMVDEAGRITLANTETERVFGYAPGELCGMSVEALVPERYRASHSHYRHEFAQLPSPRRIVTGSELYGQRKDGSEFPVEIGLNPFPTQEGIRILGVIFDISERKQAEEALERYTRELQRSNDALQQFAYIASHDLQEPLRMIASYARLLDERYEHMLDERANKYIHYIVEGAKRMQELIHTLLDYSKVASQDIALQLIDTGTILQHVLTTLAPLIEDTEAQIVCGPLPVLAAAPLQFEQVLQNLLSNALKFRADRVPRIEISAARRENGWLFQVQDNGIGIEAQNADQVFQMFQRLHSHQEYEGNGIGLAITKKIVERHGGRIWFESEFGEGTTFFFLIP